VPQNHTKSSGSAIVWMGALTRALSVNWFRKMSDLIEMPFGVVGRMGPNNHMYYGLTLDPDPHAETQCTGRMRSGDVALPNLL